MICVPVHFLRFYSRLPLDEECIGPCSSGNPALRLERCICSYLQNQEGWRRSFPITKFGYQSSVNSVLNGVLRFPRLAVTQFVFALSIKTKLMVDAFCNTINKSIKKRKRDYKGHKDWVLEWWLCRAGTKILKASWTYDITRTTSISMQYYMVVFRNKSWEIAMWRNWGDSEKKNCTDEFATSCIQPNPDF